MPPRPKIVQQATRRPGGDLLTGDPSGPLIDTGIDIGSGKAGGRHGDRIYFGLKHFVPLLHEIGWLSDVDAAKLKADVVALREENDQLHEIALRYDELVNLIAPHLEPTVVEKPVIREVYREPTHDEMKAFVRKHAAELIRDASGSRDERYRATYAGHGYVSGDQTKPKNPALKGKALVDVLDPSNAEGSDQDASVESKLAYQPATFELEGQEVVIDDLLKKSTKDVLAFVEGHGEEFTEAVVSREYELKDIKGHPHPRKGLIEGLGYEFEEDE